MSKKIFIAIANGTGGMLVVSSEKAVDTHGNFQLKGNVYAMPGMKKTQNVWFWAVDPNTGKLRRDMKSGEPRAWIKVEWARGCNVELARAIQSAYQTGAGILSPEQIAEMSSCKRIVAVKKPSIMVVEPPAASASIMPQVTAEDKAAVETDLAMLNGDKKKPIDRLKDGDPSIFLALGATSEQAEKWSAWIRENPGKINSITDVKRVRGIGRVNFTALVKAWGEKFE